MRREAVGHAGRSSSAVGVLAAGHRRRTGRPAPRTPALLRPPLPSRDD